MINSNSSTKIYFEPRFRMMPRLVVFFSELCLYLAFFFNLSHMCPTAVDSSSLMERNNVGEAM
jgi:hypothetical protein